MSSGDANSTAALRCVLAGCFGELVMVLQASQGQAMVYPGACNFIVGCCDGKLAVGLCWKGEKYSALEGWWHPSCLTHWTHTSCGTSVDVAGCLPLVRVGWMTTELLKLQLLEKHPGIVLLSPPSALLSSTPYLSLSNFFSLPQISTCFSAMLSKPLTALLLPAPRLWKVSWNLNHWCFDQAWVTSLMLFWSCFTWGRGKLSKFKTSYKFQHYFGYFCACQLFACDAS